MLLYYMVIEILITSAALENLGFLKMLILASKDGLVLWSVGFFFSFLSPHMEESVLLISQRSGRNSFPQWGPGQEGHLGTAALGGGGHGPHSGARQRPQS